MTDLRSLLTLISLPTYSAENSTPPRALLDNNQRAAAQTFGTQR